ncbi:MAG TPA: hypothetical protein VH593_18230, partial [Ktedonobacteraceae bacterium]
KLSAVSLVLPRKISHTNPCPGTDEILVSRDRELFPSGDYFEYPFKFSLSWAGKGVWENDVVACRRARIP